MNDTCCDCKPRRWGEQSYCGYKVKESRATDVANKNSYSQPLSLSLSLSLHFLGKMKLLIIFMEWGEQVTNLND